MGTWSHLTSQGPQGAVAELAGLQLDGAFRPSALPPLVLRISDTFSQEPRPPPPLTQGARFFCLRSTPCTVTYCTVPRSALPPLVFRKLDSIFPDLARTFHQGPAKRSEPRSPILVRRPSTRSARCRAATQRTASLSSHHAALLTRAVLHPLTARSMCCRRQRRSSHSAGGWQVPSSASRMCSTDWSQTLTSMNTFTHTWPAHYSHLRSFQHSEPRFEVLYSSDQLF